MTPALRVAVLGYGNQGAAQAHCLRASGWQVTVGARPGQGERRARADGFEVLGLPEAASSAPVIAALLPDEVFPKLFRESLRAALQPGAAVVFAHGFAPLYGELEWPGGVDVVLVSPTAPGSVLVQEFDAGRGVPAYLAVAVDATGGAWKTAERYARALGCDRAGLVLTTVEEEVAIDLFGEQTVLVGGLMELLGSAVDTLVAAGYSPEMAYLECAHQIKFLADLLHRSGPEGFLSGISATALYGGLTRGPRTIGDSSRQAMAEILEEIQSGDFAREFLEDQFGGGKRLAERIRAAREGRMGRLEAARRRALPRENPGRKSPGDLPGGRG